MEIKTVGVIGAGVMGRGLAQHLAQTGFQVLLVDISKTVLDHAQAEIMQNLRFQKLFQKDIKTEEPNEALGRIRFLIDDRELETVDFLVENAVEKWEVKQAIYGRIDTICAEGCVFAANTSAIPITRIASATKRPDRVVGMHFMNPVPLKKTVELILGWHTSDETLAVAKDFLSRIQKDFILVNDSPGFVTNRVLMLTVNEAIFLLQDQVASTEDVDRIFKSCFGHPMGPLETADLIGLDTILYSLDVLYDSFNDTKYRPCPLLKKMVDAGLYGRKSGQGFYTY
ncbi:MAG: 3-hydroxybutyryl-CoA dehydrogenase [Proteobacteria bacterium]|nr:3-hydroxybutyryl-CoA dehydrogenase [Pseudomonadota bacterium]